MERHPSPPMRPARAGPDSRVRLAGASLMALALGACSRAASTPLPKPGAAAGFNLLVVTFDTTRADRIGCYGAGPGATPTVDRLASHGARFVHATTVAPLTMPSHSSLFTGSTPPNHGVRDNGIFVLAEEKTSLAEILRDEGYQTAAFVSAFILSKSFGLAQGFAVYDDEVDPAELQGTGGHYTRRRGDKTAARAVTWLLARPVNRPWFAWMHLFDPHAPYMPHPKLRDSRSAYEAEITYADRQLARVIAVIERRGELDRTLILFTADHGESLGEHKENTHGLLAYDGTMHVPLILSCPTLFPGATVIDDIVASLVDVTPTLLALLGFDRPSDIDGEFLFAPLGADRAVYFESLGGYYQHGWAPLRGLRRVNDKLIDGVDPEYYDLTADPTESVNRIESPASLELRERLVHDFGPFDEMPRSTEQEGSVDPRITNQLNALGYAHSVDEDERSGLADPKRKIVNWNRTTSADDLSRAGQHDKARAKIARVLQLDPENGHAWWTAAVIARRSGNLVQAESCVRRSIEFRPIAGAHVLLAQLLLVRGEPEQSLEELVLAEAADTRLGGIYVTRGEVYLRQGREAEARVEFERGAEIDPSNWGARARARIESLSGFKR